MIKRRTAIVSVILVAVALHPLFYFTMYSGDAEIHLIYAENAAEGHFFEFNLEEKSAGVTSPGYMLILSSLFTTIPDYYVPLVVKIMNILVWYAFLALAFILAKTLTGSSLWAVVATSVVGFMPGTVYNATLGMENGLFGGLILFWMLLSLRWDWLGETDVGARRELTLGLILGVSCWIRPEGFIFTAIALSFRFASQLRMRGFSSDNIVGSFRQATVAFAPVLALSLLYFWFHYSQTGSLLPTSGVSRIMTGGQGSLQIAGLIINPKFAKFFVYYFPLVIFMIIGMFAVISKRVRHHVHSWNYYFLALILAGFFCLYSTILGAHHLSRYIIFLVPMMVAFGAIGARWVSANWQVSSRLKVASYIGVSLVMCLLFSCEVYLRYQSGSNYPPGELWEAMNAPEDRESFSNRLYDMLGHPSDLPVSLAYQEVQIRYWLDERFVVRSLDGRVDPMLLDFVDESGNYDHIGYIEARGIDYVMETPNYNRDAKEWSLSELRKLCPAQTLSYKSLEFTRIPSGYSVRRPSVAEID